MYHSICIAAFVYRLYIQYIIDNSALGTATYQASYHTVRVISPVQSEHTCSEMRYCNHREQCPWRCFTARQDNKHTLVGLSRPPRKSNVAPGKCRSTEQFSQTISAVKTGVQVESMLVRKRHRYPALTMVCAKTGQLSTVVSSFDSKAMA